MMTKRCGECGLVKSSKQFYLRRTGERAGHHYEKCIECMKLRGRKYYFDNHNRQLNLALIRRRNARNVKRQYVNSVKDVPCSDCGRKYEHYVMDFDHRNPKDKIHDVTYMIQRNWALEKIKNEIDKCDIVCANCHRRRTYKNLPG